MTLKYVKRCLILFAIREIQIDLTLKYVVPTDW